MKKLIVFFAIFFIPSVLAISTDIKETYQPGETLIAEIAGNILSSIQPENVELKRQNVQVPWEYDIKRLNDKYFLYGILPSVENNYTLIIKDITTTVSGRVEVIDFNQSFSTSGELITYSINPGFIIAMDDEFEIKVFLNKDFPETITINFPEEHELTLNSGENIIKFSTIDIESGLTIIQIGIYSVPVLVIKELQQPQIILPQLRFFPRSIESIVMVDEPAGYPFSIINSGNEEITDFVFEFDQEIFVIEPAFADVIGPDETLNFTLRPRIFNQPIDEVISLMSGDLVIEFPVQITYTENLDEVNTPYLDEEYSETQGYNCSELSGESCTAGEECSTETVSSLDVSSCCLGSCFTPDSSEKSFSWVGYLIAAFIIIILMIVLGRYFKKRKQKGNPLKKRVEEYKK